MVVIVLLNLAHYFLDFLSVFKNENRSEGLKIHHDGNIFHDYACVIGLSENYKGGILKVTLLF